MRRPSHPVTALASLFALFGGSAPAGATVLTLDSPPVLLPVAGFVTISVAEVDDPPGVIEIGQVPSLGGTYPLNLSLINRSSETLTELDLEVGALVNGAFQPGIGGTVFLAPVALPTVPSTSEDASKLSDNNTLASLDLKQIFRASGGLEPTGPIVLDLQLLPPAATPLAFRLTLSTAPEPSSLAIAFVGLVALRRRPLRRVQ